MGRRSARGQKDEAHAEVVSRLVALLRSETHISHRLGAPAKVLDSDLPSALATVYRAFDGASLFFEALTLRPAADIVRLPSGPEHGAHFLVGELEGDDLVVDSRARVFRHEGDTDEWLAEGSDFVRWLLGAVEAASLMYDDEGEFAEHAFEESGELSLETSARMYRAVLARDRKAPAPRWRLARVMAARGDLEAAREHLEEVVAESPGFAWAWFDLGRISERLDQPRTALDEFVAAAECSARSEYQAFFWAHAARLAADLGESGMRAEYAGKALARDSNMVRSQREGGNALLADGDARGAFELGRLAAALAPRDLEVLDLMRRAQAALDADEYDDADEDDEYDDDEYDDDEYDDADDDEPEPDH